jgi:hypothetical protein
MEHQALSALGIDGIVLRNGVLYGPGTWYETLGRKPALHVDAAAQVALLVVTHGGPVVYVIEDDDGAVLIGTACRTELRVRCRDRSADVARTQVLLSLLTNH